MQVQMMNFSSHSSSHSSSTASSHKPKPNNATVPGRIPHRSPPVAPSPWPRNVRQFHDVAYKVPAAAVKAPGPPGPIALIRSIVEAHGYRGLWLGHTGTMFRETGGSAAWFIVKEYATQMFVERRLAKTPMRGGLPSKRDLQPLVWESAVSGAMAGAAGALILYPADTVKSAIQTAEEMGSLRGSGATASSSSMAGVTSDSSRTDISRKPRPGKVGIGTTDGFWSTFVKMYRVHGVKGLYAGCGMTVARAIPSSGIIFVVYDGLNNWFA